jgi:3-methyladenine DNA glycosylase/8-oxoguanine DNA glycosylase
VVDVDVGAPARSAGWCTEIELVGAGGEPVDLWRTFLSHGVASLPPMRVDEAAGLFEVTLRISGGRPRTVQVTAGRPGHAVVSVLGRAPGRIGQASIVAAVSHVLRLDEDLSPFYASVASDPDLAWAAAGAGRMIRSQTVFEEVVKTICTTNCAWSATERMVAVLVSSLGEPALGTPAEGPGGRAFPTPQAMAEADERFYREVVRAGYRGRYLRSLASTVATGSLDLEELGRLSAEELPDEEVERRLLALPGVGPYAAAHIMMMLGRYSNLILDSWTRPTYARLAGRTRPASDKVIRRRFARHGTYAGLAFWLFLTRGWVDATAAPVEE